MDRQLALGRDEQVVSTVKLIVSARQPDAHVGAVGLDFRLAHPPAPKVGQRRERPARGQHVQMGKLCQY